MRVKDNKYNIELRKRAIENRKLAQEANKTNGLSRQVLHRLFRSGTYRIDKAGTRTRQWAAKDSSALSDIVGAGANQLVDTNQ